MEKSTKGKDFSFVVNTDGRSLDFNKEHPEVIDVYSEISYELGAIEFEKIDTKLSFSKRRVFHKTLDHFADDINLMAHHVPNFIENVIYLKTLIDLGQFDTIFQDKEQFPEFIKVLDELFFSNTEIINIIDKKVEVEYLINIESENRDNQLQFKNSYAKAINKSAMLLRIVIPFLCVLMERLSLKKADVQFMDVAFAIFPIFSTSKMLRTEGTVDLAIKIQKFVESSVSNTLYSDQVMWKYLKNSSVNEKTMSIEIHRNIICNIIPKLIPNRSVVSFFHVVIKNQLDYLFTSKFKVEYKAISVIQVDSDKPNPFTRIEQRLVRSTGELELLYNRLDIDNFINRNIDTIDGYICDFDWWIENIVIHTAQTKILELFVRKHVNPDISIYSLDKITYVALCMIAREWAKEKGFTFISHLLLARPLVPTDGKKIKNKYSFKKGKILAEVMASKIFISINNHYRLLDPEMSERIIFDFLQQIINAVFEVFELPDGNRYEMPEDINVKVAINEVLHYIEQI